MNRRMFNTHAADWSVCMDKCLKYNRSMAPSFTTKEEIDELMSWALNTTTDPISKVEYSDALGRGVFWVPYRFVCCNSYSLAISNGQMFHFIVTKMLRVNGEITIQVIWLMIA